jgi:hypothetical protein
MQRFWCHPMCISNSLQVQYFFPPVRCLMSKFVSLLPGLNILCHTHHFFRTRPVHSVHSLRHCLNSKNMRCRLQILKQLWVSCLFVYDLLDKPSSSLACTGWRKSLLTGPVCCWTSSVEWLLRHPIQFRITRWRPWQWSWRHLVYCHGI